MEATQNKQESTTGGTQTNPSPNPSPIPAGFDISSLLKNEGLMEILKHLLSGAGAMAGNYFIWIKPLQDKMEAMSAKIDDQEIRIKELEAGQQVLIAEIKKTKSPTESNTPEKRHKSKHEYFELRGKTPKSHNHRPRQGFKF